MKSRPCLASGSPPAPGTISHDTSGGARGRCLLHSGLGASYKLRRGVLPPHVDNHFSDDSPPFVAVACDWSWPGTAHDLAMIRIADEVNGVPRLNARIVWVRGIPGTEGRERYSFDKVDGPYPPSWYDRKRDYLGRIW